MAVASDLLVHGQVDIVDGQVQLQACAMVVVDDLALVDHGSLVVVQVNGTPWASQPLRL